MYKLMFTISFVQKLFCHLLDVMKLFLPSAGCFNGKEKTAFLEHHKTALKELRQFKRVIEKSEIDEHA